MVHQLLSLIVAQLRTGLTGILSNPNGMVVLGPVNAPNLAARPLISCQIGALSPQKSVLDDGSGEPRPVELREVISVDGGNPGGPYALAQTPLEGTVAMQVVRDLGGVEEYAEHLLPGIDFTVDLQGPSVTVLKDIAGADVLRVVYSFVGISMVREFTQGIYVDVYSDGWVASDQLVSLVTTIVHTQHGLLLEQFNFTSPVSFAGNGYQSQAFLQKIRLQEIAPFPAVSGQALGDAKIRLSWEVTGLLRMSRTLSGGFGIITSIHSRGQSGPGVNVVPGVG